MRIARTPEGKRIRIGEGGNSVVYKAIMHNYDEVALKLVRMTQPSQAELQLFEKEVSSVPCLLFGLVADLLVSFGRFISKSTTACWGSHHGDAWCGMGGFECGVSRPD